MVQLAANPHSSAENAEMVEETRKAVLRHFNTDNRHYDLIFTSGATASIKDWLEMVDKDHVTWVELEDSQWLYDSYLKPDSSW